MDCDLCAPPPGTPLWQDALCRVVLVVEERGYPGFCRVIWKAHVREMTDLGKRERAHLMRVVFAVESALRELLKPDKINLASLGNMTPHVHWHVIPRFGNDPHFPQSVWSSRQRETQLQVPPHLASKLAAALASKLG
jgi:diadenosine tetraphosphate (Ap4A) HIT family hydrolase